MILSIVYAFKNFKKNFLTIKFILSIHCKARKEVFKKDVKNLVSKQIFTRWQAVLSVFDFDTAFIKGASNCLQGNFA